MLENFGKAFIKEEGTPLHPKVSGWSGTPENYQIRLKAYNDYHGIKESKIRK